MVFYIPANTPIISKDPEEWQLNVQLLGTDGTSVEPGDIFIYDDDFWEATGLVTKNGQIVGYTCLRHQAFTA